MELASHQQPRLVPFQVHSTGKSSCYQDKAMDFDGFYTGVFDKAAKKYALRSSNAHKGFRPELLHQLELAQAAHQSKQ